MIRRCFFIECYIDVTFCVTGKSFRQWLSEYRLSMFVEMLRTNPDASLDELMLRCGYKDQSTFRCQFKATYGMTASKYRKKVQGGT